MKRSAPLKRKATKRRAPGVGCQVRHGRRVCRRDAIMVVGNTRCCAKHAADLLFARHIRESGPCRAQGVFGISCSVKVQCAHIITRARESIRWSTDNAMVLCEGHHVWFTHNPAAWKKFVSDQGIDWDELYRRGYNDPPEDPLAVIARYQEAA